ncbi:protease SohB [Pseudomonas aeruginosa]
MDVVFWGYIGFLLKVVTGVVAVAVLAVVLARPKADGTGKEDGELQVTVLNDFYDDLHDTVGDVIYTKAERKQRRKAEKAERKRAAKEEDEVRTPKVFVIDFEGDVRASSVRSMRHEVTAALSHAVEGDEVVVRLESPGGTVDGYGLAASQLGRVRDAGIPLTICVDNVAASGGYMMACLGNKILGAPFSVVGSIGVVAQVPNVHRLLKKHDVDIDVLTAGEYKRTLTVFGENTDKGREKFKEDLESIHGLFKRHVQKYRPSVKIEEVATGESWWGEDALAKNLIDEIKTSDEYLQEKAETCELIQLQFKLPRKSWLKSKLGIEMASVVESFFARLNSRRMGM